MHATARRRAASAALLLVAAMPPAARAQGSDSSAFGGTFFTRRDAALAALFTAGTIAMFPLDRSIAMGTRGSSLQRNDFVRRSANLFRITAIPGSTMSWMKVNSPKIFSAMSSRGCERPTMR